MSINKKRRKSQLKNLRIYLAKNIFNSRFIVRNITAATVLITLVATVVGLVSVSDSEPEEHTEYVINYVGTANMQSGSATVLKAQIESEALAAVEANQTEMVSATTHEFDTKFITVSSEVNIRREASADSDIVGKLTTGNVGDILGTEGDWYKISSGSVTGYVKADLVVTGAEAEKIAATYKKTTGTINTTDVAIWTEPTRESAIICGAYQNVTYTVDGEATSTLNGWVCVVLDDGSRGYIGAAYIDISDGYTEASPYEAPVEEKEIETDNETVSVSEQNSQEVKNETTDNRHEMTYTARGSFQLTEEEINLIAAVVSLEAGGESYDGKLAVANVVLNRLESGKYGSSVSAIVYAPSQFTVVNKPAFQTVLANGADESSVQAVKDACAGNNNVGACIGFKPTWNVDTSSLSYYIQIGNHIFFY